MSLLNSNNEVTKQEQIELEVRSILDSPRRTAEMLVSQWERDFDALWKVTNATPEEKLEAIGEKAADLFSLNTQWTNALIAILGAHRQDLVAKISSKISALPDFTVNNDGTVTLD